MNGDEATSTGVRHALAPPVLLKSDEGSDLLEGEPLEMDLEHSGNSSPVGDLDENPRMEDDTENGPPMLMQTPGDAFLNELRSASPAPSLSVSSSRMSSGQSADLGVSNLYDIEDMASEQSVLETSTSEDLMAQAELMVLDCNEDLTIEMPRPNYYRGGDGQAGNSVQPVAVQNIEAAARLESRAPARQYAHATSTGGSEHDTLGNNLKWIADEWRLSVCSADIEEIPAELGDTYGNDAIRLDLSCNQLKRTSNLQKFVKVEELLLDNNNIGDDFVLPIMPHLRTLSLNKNSILDLKRLLHMLQRSCPRLTFLSLISNGACPDGLIWGTSDDDYARYRQKVLAALPNLVFLDSTTVTDEERSKSKPGNSAISNIAQRLSHLKAKILGQEEDDVFVGVDHSYATLPFYNQTQLNTSFLGFQYNKFGVLGLALLADKWVVASGTDGSLKVFDLMEGKWQYKCVAILKGHVGRVRSVACFPDVRVVSAGDDKTIRIWNLALQKCLRTLVGHHGPVNGVLAMSDGRVASCSDDTTIRIWEVARKTPITLKGHKGAVVCIASGESNTILSGSTDETFKIWDYMCRTCLVTTQAHAGSVLSIMYLGGGKIVTGGSDCVIHVWQLPENYLSEDNTSSRGFYAEGDVDTNEDVVVRAATFRGHRNSVTALHCRSGDENTFISAGADKFIAKWDIAQGKCTSVLKGHTDTVFAVVPFGADNTRLVSCSKDIKLWDMEEGIDDEMGSRAALAESFNNITAESSVPQRMQLWSSVKTAFLKYNSRGQHRHANSGAYAALSTAYPSTIGMFATPLRDPDAADEDDGMASDARLLNMTSVTNAVVNMYNAVNKDIRGVSSKVQQWKQNFTRRKGHTIVDWLGILKGKRMQHALRRLSELCECSEDTRITYLVVKNRLIAEFGEELFESMKEQVSVELAMRDFVLANGGALSEKSPVKGKAKFFPGASPHQKTHIIVGEENEENDSGDDDVVYDNGSTFPHGNGDGSFAPGPQHPPLDMEMLQSFFDDMGKQIRTHNEDESARAQKFDDVTKDFEKGTAVSETFFSDIEDLVVSAVENSILLNADADDGVAELEEEPNSVEPTPTEAAPEEVITFRDEVWA
eukprot:m.1156268 g.1156268  ORF g.1156268 m.1156268 type:complete len:1107 (-) comp24493_c0_seq4:257-3577(-)